MGYQFGFKEGYCYQTDCIAPIPPICPLPNINESNDSYKDGYLRGFLDGRESIHKKTNNSFNQYTPRQYSDYIEPYDFNLLKKELELKQLQYNNQNTKLHRYYQEKLSETINRSENYYDVTLEFITKYASYIIEFKDLKKLLEINDPRIIHSSYPKNLTIKQCQEILEKLELNNKFIKDNVVFNANNLISWIVESPNNIILGKFEFNEITDYYYNSKNNAYEKVKYIIGKSYIYFDKNIVYYYRYDNNEIITSSIRYSGLKMGSHVFEDGFGGIIIVDPELKNVTIFYERDKNSSQYMRKAIYHNIKRV